MIMSGSLAEWSVEDLLQLVRITQKTTSIRLVGDSCSGAVHLSGGAIVKVEVDPTTGDAGDDFSRTVDGLRVLTALVDGAFEFCSPDFDDPGTRFDIEDILTAVQKDIRREQRIRDLGIADDQHLVLTDQPTGPVTFQSQAWQLLAPLLPAFSLAQLDRRFGRGRAVATVLMLEALGVLQRQASAVGEAPEAIEAPVSDRVDGAQPAGAPFLAVTVQADPEVAGGADRTRTAPPMPPADQPADDEQAGAGNGASTAGDERATDQLEAPRRSLVPVIDAGDTLGAHYVEIFDNPAHPGSGTPNGDLTLVSGVLNDIRSRFRAGPSQIDAGFHDDE